MPESQKTRLTDSVKEAAPFLEAQLTISIFGHPIINWKFPPSKS